MPGIFSIFTSRKPRLRQEDKIPSSNSGQLRMESAENGFIKVTKLSKKEGSSFGGAGYEAELRKAQELTHLRAQKLVTLIAAKFEELIEKLDPTTDTGPGFLATPASEQTEEQRERADKAMEQAREFAHQEFFKDQAATIIQREFKRRLAQKAPKEKLDREKRRANRKKLLVQSSPYLRGLVTAGVLEQDRHTGKVKLGSNPNARFQEEFTEYEPSEEFDSPLRLPTQEEFRVISQKADTILNQRFERKPKEKVAERAEVKKAERVVAPKRKKMTRRERLQALISANPFFSRMREPIELQVRGERFTVEAAKPSELLREEFDAAFAELDAEA